MGRCGTNSVQRTERRDHTRRRAFAELILVLFLPLTLVARPAGDSLAVFQPGEELYYNVSYGGLNIGQVHVRITGSSGTGAATTYTARVTMDSYPGLPFVNLHSVYEDSIASPCHARWFTSRTRDDDRWLTSTYTFDYPGRRLFVDRGIWKSRVDHRDTLRLDAPHQDGLSLFFFARANMIPGRRYRVPTVVSEKQGITTLVVAGGRSAESVDAIEYPVDVLSCEGDAGFVGVFGFTGHFEGWFSNDAARVPILARLHVILGTVRLELMKWSRPGWVPPRAPGKEQ